ncbi:MAG: DUF4157 domain-containing protein [bacterium]|nr:DUF4157 domain-containing protein [bacterium]
MGKNPGEVRVPTGNRADKLAKSINAEAFTTGHDIVFAARNFDPGSQKGKKLLGHELTHVLQQKKGGVQRKSRVPEVQRKENDERVDPKTVKVLKNIESDLNDKIDEIGDINKKIQTKVNKLIDITKKEYNETYQEKGVKNYIFDFLDMLEVEKNIYPYADMLFNSIGLPTFDGLIISFSGSGHYFIGAGIGLEFVHVRGIGWQLFGQAGIGLGYGAGGAAEIGVIWGLDSNPENYSGSFVELQGSFGKIGLSLFGWVSSETGSDDIKVVWGFKGGLSAGTSGGAAMYERYLWLYDHSTGETKPLPDNAEEYEKAKRFFRNPDEYLRGSFGL